MFNFLSKECEDHHDPSVEDIQVIRPRPPFMLYIAVGIWVSSAAVYYLYYSMDVYLIVLFVVILSGAIFFLIIGKSTIRSSLRVPAVFLLVGLLVGALAGAGAAVVHAQNIEQVEKEGKNKTYVFEVIEDTRSGDFSDFCLAKTQLSTGAIVHVRLYVETDEPIRYGTLFSASTQLMSPGEKTFQYYWTKEIAASAIIGKYVLHERDDLVGQCVLLRNAACDLFTEYGNRSNVSFLKAILFGERTDLSKSEFYQEVRVVGLAHLVAVSGAHLVIVSSFVGVVLRKVGLNKRAVIAIQIIFTLIYLVLTAFPVSALRAGCMSCIAMTSYYGKRRSSSLNGLAVCIVGMIALTPSVSLSVSFLLSALSTLGIIVFARYFQSALQRTFKKIPQVILESFALTLAASLLITPITAALFSQISLISPLINIAVAFPFTLLCVFGLLCVCAALLLPVFSGFFASIILFLAEAFCEIVSFAAQIPYASIPAAGEMMPACVESFLILLILWVWWPNLTSRLFFGVAVMSFSILVVNIVVFPCLSEDEIVMLDVGQGDAFVIRSKGRAVLVDTGNNTYELLEGLAGQGIYRLDAVIISHADDDHCGSLSALRGVVKVDRVCVAAGAATCECDSCIELINHSVSLVGDQGVELMKVGDTMRIGSFSLKIVWPNEFRDEGGNADSLSFLLSYGEFSDEAWSAFFCGDLEAEEIRLLIDAGRVGDIDILKVGHHGSRKSLDESCLAILSPEIALISVGEKNSYGHPTDEVIDALVASGCKIARTDRDGDVVCKLGPERIEMVSVG